MTEAERQAILSSAKTFFRTRIAENHKANTEKLTSLSKFNINPFTHKYLAQFAFGDSSPESMAKALIGNSKLLSKFCIGFDSLPIHGLSNFYFRQVHLHHQPFKSYDFILTFNDPKINPFKHQ